MPRYVFECQDCNLRFERTLSLGAHVTHECPQCKELAPAVIEGFAFGFVETPGAPANSGVHKDDYPTADHAIGKDSEKRWRMSHARDVVKKEARKQGGTDALIRHTSPDHLDYEPMSDVGRKAHFNLAKRAVEAVKLARESQKSK
jgi:putative FmdB family regulatory protein